MKDLTGQTFGMWYVIELDKTDKYHNVWWRCRCVECGAIQTRLGACLRSGKSWRCPVCTPRKNRKESTRRIDLTGQRFGAWFVIERDRENPSPLSYWRCRCEKCGTIRSIPLCNLTRGLSTQCKECSEKSLVKHGDSRDGKYSRHARLYTIWGTMKDRCLNPKNTNYHRYGGRGITVCDEWQRDYVAFREWSLAHGYDDSLTIDRIDNNKGYSPDNCRWATQKEQLENLRRNIWIEYQGETHTMSEWSRRFGINTGTICSRYHRGDRGDHLFRAVQSMTKRRA